MGHNDAVFRRFQAVVEYRTPFAVCHFQTVNQHERTDFCRYHGTPKFEHLLDVCVLEEQAPVKLVVFLVECAACHDNENCHVIMPLRCAQCSRCFVSVQSAVTRH